MLEQSKSVLKHITNHQMNPVARRKKIMHKVYTADLQNKVTALKQTVQCCKAPCT